MPSDKTRNYLYQRLAAQLPPAGLTWLQKQLNQLQSEKDFYLAFSMAPRFTGKKPLTVSEEDGQEANEIRRGFDPRNWTTDQAARTLLVLAIPHQSPDEYLTILNKVFSTADLNELATLYASLPLLPYPELHVKRAAEGVRTTMTQVFDAIALGNPYPHDYLPEDAWNQMVLKAVFNVRPLHRIYGLDNRRNEKLARMLVDYAHERWAAGRTLTPELWRLVGPFLLPEDLSDMERLCQSPEAIQREAAALALSESKLPEASTLLDRHTAEKNKMKTGNLNWRNIGDRAYSS